MKINNEDDLNKGIFIYFFEKLNFYYIRCDIIYRNKEKWGTNITHTKHTFTCLLFSL